MVLRSTLAILILLCTALTARAQLHIIGGAVPKPSDDISLRIARLKTEAFSPTMGRLHGTCSGVFLSPKVILTAGHCVKSLDDDAVVRKVTISIAGQEIEAKRWVASPDYKKIRGAPGSDDVTPLADLGIVELNQAVPREVIISELPSAEIMNEKQIFLIAGFGKSDANANAAGTLAFSLSEGTLADVLGGRDQQIKIEGAQACHGDSGGAVYQPKGGRYTLVGIISNGKRDCSGDTKAMSVYRHLPWIQKLLERLGQ